MNIEDNLLSGCLSDPKIFRMAQKAKIRTTHIEDSTLKYIYFMMEKVAKTESPNSKAVEQAIRLDEGKSVDYRSAVIKKIRSLVSEGGHGSTLSIEKIKQQRKQADLTQAIFDAAADLKSKEDPEEIAKALRAALANVDQDGDEYEVFNYVEEYAERILKRREVSVDSGKTVKMVLNLSPFQPYFPRGAQPGEVTAVAGPTYAGKSVLLTNLVRVAASPENGFNCLYIFAENRMIQAASRLDSVLLGRDYNELYEAGLEDGEIKDLFEREMKEEGWGKIFMAKVQPKRFTTITIRNIIEEIEAEHGIEINALFIDSPDHQMPEAELKEWHLNKGNVYYDIKRLGEDKGLITFTTLPMKPSSVKKEFVSAEDAGGSYDISRVCDNIIMFNLGDDDRLLSRGRIQVTKARDGKTDNQIIPFYFESSNRMLPWDEVFDGAVDPALSEGDAGIFSADNFESSSTAKEEEEVEMKVEPLGKKKFGKRG